MTTKNPKISGYISQEIFDQFKLLCTDKGLSSSQGIGYILSEYFGEPPSEPSSEPPSEPSSEPPSEPSSEPPSGLLSELLRRIEVIEEKISELPSELPSGSLPVIEDSIPITTTPSPSPPVTISWGAIHTLAGLVPPKSRNTYNAQIIIDLVKAQRGEDWKFDGKNKNFSKIL